jgi:hypothetical protein
LFGGPPTPDPPLDVRSHRPEKADPSSVYTDPAGGTTKFIAGSGEIALLAEIG